MAQLTIILNNSLANQFDREKAEKDTEKISKQRDGNKMTADKLEEIRNNSQKTIDSYQAQIDKLTAKMKKSANVDEIKEKYHKMDLSLAQMYIDEETRKIEKAEYAYKWIEWRTVRNYTENLYFEQTQNGLVNAFLMSYNNHLPLKISPDMLHIALQQIISTFVNNNAKELRELFVEHEEKKSLVVGLMTTDFGEFSQAMNRLIQSSIKNPEFLDNLRPEYSTTTTLITSISAMLVMNTLKEYFSYEFVCMCGIPSVILEGTQEDWHMLNKKYNYLKQMFIGKANKELDEWFPCMDKIMELFIGIRKSATEGIIDATEYQKEMFSRVISLVPYGSGGETKLGGWISVLVPYTENNKIIKNISKIPCLNIDMTEEKYCNGISEWDCYGRQDKLSEYYLGRTWSSLQNSLYETPVKFTLNNVSYDTIVCAGLSQYCHVDKDTNKVSCVFEYKILQDNDNKIQKTTIINSILNKILIK